MEFCAKQNKVNAIVFTNHRSGGRVFQAGGGGGRLSHWSSQCWLHFAPQNRE